VETYFDRREGRVKPVPDCSKHGLVWDEETQRCERAGDCEGDAEASIPGWVVVGGLLLLLCKFAKK